MKTKPKNPCMNCPKVGCGVYHDKCPEYQAFRHGKELEYAERKEKSDRLSYNDDAYHRRMRSFGKKSQPKQR